MDKIFVNIDSTQRDIVLFPNPSFFNLDNIINNNIQFKNVNYISLVNAEIPISNVNIFSSNNYNIDFKVKTIKTGLPGGTFIPENINKDYLYIKIPTKNYETDTIVNDINISLQNMGQLNNNNLGLYFELVNGVFKINNTLNNVTYIINFDNNNISYLSLGYLLGFRKKIYEIKPLTYITNEAPYNFNPYKYIFIRINDYGYYYPNPKIPLKVLSKLNYDNNKKLYIYTNGSGELWESYKFKQPTDIKKLEVELLDYTGNRFNINEDFNFTIEIGMSYNEYIYNDSVRIMESINKPIVNDYITKYLNNESDNNQLLLNYNDFNNSTQNSQDKILQNNSENITFDQIFNKKKFKKKKNKKLFNFNY